MNKKGVLFVSDLVVAFSLFVLLVAAFFVANYYLLGSVGEKNKNQEMILILDAVENYFAMNKNSCTLVNKEGEEIKKIVYCVSKDRDYNLLVFENERFGVYAEAQNLNIVSAQLPANANFIEKDVNVIVFEQNKISKKDFLDFLKDQSFKKETIKVFVYEK